MYSLTINELTKEQFLQHSWQKKTLLIKRALLISMIHFHPKSLPGLLWKKGLNQGLYQ